MAGKNSVTNQIRKKNNVNSKSVRINWKHCVGCDYGIVVKTVPYPCQQPKFGDRSAAFGRRLHELKGKYLGFMLGADYGSSG